MKKTSQTISALILMLFFALTPFLFLSAQTNTGVSDPVEINITPGGGRVLDRMQNVASSGGFDTGGATAPQVVGLIINALLSITGLVFIILTVFAGFNWMTSQGNEEAIKKSKNTLTASIIGIIITFSAWTIWNFIFKNLIL